MMCLISFCRVVCPQMSSMTLSANRSVVCFLLPIFLMGCLHISENRMASKFQILGAPEFLKILEHLKGMIIVVR